MDFEDLHLLADTISSLSNCDKVIRKQIQVVSSREALATCLATVNSLEATKVALENLLSDTSICGCEDDKE